ncbi:magnesium chelatase, partial [Pseudomonas avellanae]
AAWRGAGQIDEQDIEAVAEFALRHRRRDPAPPPQNQQAAPPETSPKPDKPESGQGNWGELPAQAVVTGSRREVPSWPKKP